MGNLMLTTKRRLNQISFIQIDLKTSENWFQEYLEVRIKERKGIGEHESMFYASTRIPPCEMENWLIQI